jgi:hypothetical protein
VHIVRPDPLTSLMDTPEGARGRGWWTINEGSGMVSSLQVSRRRAAGCCRPSQCKMQFPGI